MAFITAATRSDIVELAMGMLNQAPSTAMLNTLIEKSTAGSSIQDLADYIATTDAFTAEYPSTQTAKEFATEMFAKLITGGTLDAAINTAVIDLLEGMLTAGTTKAEGFVAVIDYLSNTANNTNADLGDISKSFQNRADAAEYFSITKELGGSTDAELAAAIASVTSDAATLTAANAAADTSAAAVTVVDSQSFTLTTGLDDKTLGGGADSAFASDSTTAASDTFNASDKIDGGAGEDTFFLTVDSLSANTTYVPSRITNFEKLSVTNIDATPDTVIINTNLMGLTSVQVSASSAPVSFTNLDASTSVEVTGNTAAVDVQLKNAGLTGTADSVTIAMIGNTGGLTVDSSGAQDIEKATITATGVNSGTLVIGDNSGSTITDLTVDGAGSLAITSGNLATITTLDASANTGGVTYVTQVTAETVTLTGGAGNDTLTGNTGDDVITGGAGADALSMGSAGGDDNVSGGAGNDTITVAGVNKNDTIDGGEGTDTLKINGALTYSATAGTNDAAGITGFETLYVDTSLSQDMTPLTGITTLMAGPSDVATLTKVDGITTVALLGAGAGADLTLATDGTADSLVVALGLDSTQTNTSSSTLDMVQYETMTVSSAGADNNVVTAKADVLTGLTVIGSKNVTINLNPNVSTTALVLKTIDASAATGTVNVQASGADSGVTVTPGSDALTVNLGDGADTVTGTAKADSLTTGKGNDIIVGSGGDDTVDAGEGDDKVTLLAGDNDVTLGKGADELTAGDGANTVTNTSGNSTVTLGNGVNTVTNTAGNMTVVTGSAIDTITNTAGNADITSGGGNDVITNTAGNSDIDSGTGNDSITLTAGNSTVDAGAGNDSIALGSGNDTVDGGAGTDSATFSHGTGIYASSISNVETVTGTMTASGTIDLDNITGVTTLKVTANATVASLTVKDVATGTTLNVSDDLAEDSSAGDIQALVIDTAAEATMTLKVLGNQEASVVAAADTTGVTITDVDALTITADGGPTVDQAVTHDLEALTLDATDTTSLVVNTATNGGINIGVLDGADAVDSIKVTLAAEGDFIMDSASEVDALSLLNITASGEADVTVGEVGSAGGAILDTLTLSASSGATMDVFASNITSTTDMTSVSITADGAGSSITMEGDIVSGESGAGTVTFTASEGGVIESNDGEVFDFATVTTMTLATEGTGSTFTMEGAAMEGVMTNLVIDAEGTAAVLDIGAGEFDDDIDSLAVTVGAYSKLNAVGGLAFTDEAGMESFSFNVAANGIVDTTSAGSEATDGITVTSASFAAMEISIGASSTIEEDMLTIFSTGEEGGVTDLDLDIDAGTSAVIVDFEAVDAGDDTNLDGGDFVTIATVPVILAADDAVDGEGDGTGTLGWDEGSVNITGSAAHTVDLGEAAEGFSVTTGSGADTITAGDGNDTINTGAGGDLINVTATGSASVTGGIGADDFSFQTEATTFGTTTITDFLSGVDDLSISGIGTSIAVAENTVSAARAQAAIGDNDIEFVALNASTTAMTSDGTETITDFESMADVIAYLGEGYTAAASDEVGIMLNDGTNSYFYLFLDAGDTGIEADEIQLVAQFTGEILVAADVS